MKTDYILEGLQERINKLANEINLRKERELELERESNKISNRRHEEKING